MQPMALPRK